MKNFASTKIQKHQVLVTEYSFVSSKCVMKFSEEAHPRQVQPVLGPCKYSTKQVFIHVNIEYGRFLSESLLNSAGTFSVSTIYPLCEATFEAAAPVWVDVS